MKRTAFLSFIGFFLINILCSCDTNQVLGEITQTPETNADILPSPQATQTKIPVNFPTETVLPNEYHLCGQGELVPVPYFFKDVHGVFSPTQVVRSNISIDKVRRTVSVITCLQYEQGWKSDPAEVEEGYENVIVFFDKYGKAHPYRLIIGGHYILPYDPVRRDIIASKDGINKDFFELEHWMDLVSYSFSSNGSRQIGVILYLEDTKNGDQSNVLRQVYAFKETNLLIEQALKTGEGYPHDLPDGFFLYGMESWLITPDE